MLEGVSAPRAAWLLARLRFRRQLNQLGALYRFRKATAQRSGTRGKSSGWVLTLLVTLAMLGNFTNLSYQSLVNMRKALGTAVVPNEARRGWLGVQMAPLPADPAHGGAAQAGRGVRVRAVIAGGPAKLAGLRAGDVLLAIDGEDVALAGDVSRVVAALPAGTEVRLLMRRDGAEETRFVRLGSNPLDAGSTARPIPPAPGSTLAPGMLAGATLQTMFLILAALTMTLASREITRAEWDLEWLATLPLPLGALIAGRLAERSLTNTAGLLMLGPFLTVLAFTCGYGLAAPLVGIALTLVLLPAVATAQTLIDTGLRLSLAPAKLRNLHALVSVVSVVPLMLALSSALRVNAFVFDWAAGLPAWTAYLPTGLVVRALAAADPVAALPFILAALAEILAFAALGFVLLERQLRDGVVAAGAREGVVRGADTAQRKAADIVARPTLLPPVQRRELRLLGRDRAFMSQTLILPVIVVGTQLFLNARGNVFAGAVEQPQNLAAIAFGMASYMLMLSAFQTLNAEGQALWILYCVPHPLESVLWQKARLWGVAALIYPLAIFAIALGMAGHASLDFAVAAATVLLGVPIFAVVATALGVFGCDPLAQDVQRRLRPSYTYLYLTLASLYVYAVYASTVWQRVGTVILTALLAVALWQKARDRFDYLLDPTASPPARVSVADGMIAALLFFVLQALAFVALRGLELSPVRMVSFAFAIAGGVTYGLMRFFYWRLRTAGVPRILDAGAPRALLLGLAGGGAAAVCGLAYIAIASRLDLLPQLRLPDDKTQTPLIWLGLLAVLAAPVFEEFIFRGLIFGGLRRTYGVTASMLASAAIFAIIHPPLSVVPVFLMALCAAYVYERSRMLIAPMLVHAIYNAVVLGVQWGFMQ